MIFRNRSIPVQKKISLIGILTALTIISLMAASWLPTSKLFFLAASSLFSSIIIIKIDLASALLLYTTTTILAFLLIPSKAIFIAYFLFFGLYGIIKFLCEQLSSIVLSWIAKIIAFNVSLLIAYLLAGLVFSAEISSKLPLPVLWLIGQIIFIVYDIVYTSFIGFYYERLDKLI